MSKSSEEARQWANNNTSEDDELGYGQYNNTLEELFLTESTTEEKHHDTKY